VSESSRGSCLCGAVSYSVRLPVKWVAHCHCSLCRKANGAAFVTWFGVEQENFILETGREVLKWYSHTQGAERGFCECCGSSMFFKSAHWPREMHLTFANMEQEIKQLPQLNAYYDTHVEWSEVNGLKKVHEDGSIID